MELSSEAVGISLLASEVHCRTKRGIRVREAVDRSYHSLHPAGCLPLIRGLDGALGGFVTGGGQQKSACPCMRKGHIAELYWKSIGKV